MKKLIEIFILFIVIQLSACQVVSTESPQIQSPPVPTRIAPSEQEVESTEDQISSVEESVVTIDEPIESDDLQITNITIDGKPDDWEGREELVLDPVGDTTPGYIDLHSCRAFTNMDALYLLCEPDDPTASFFQFAVNIQLGDRIMTYFAERDSRYGFRVQTAPTEEVFGEDKSSLSAYDSAFEGRFDLSVLGDPEEVQLLEVFITAEVDDEIIIVDTWSPDHTPIVNEIDPPFITSDEDKYVLARYFQLPEGYVAEAIYEPKIPDIWAMARSETGIIYFLQRGFNAGITVFNPYTYEVTRILDFPLAQFNFPIDGPGDTMLLGINQEVWQIYPDGTYDIWGELNDAWPQYYSSEDRLYGVSGDRTRLIELFPDGSSQEIASGFGSIHDLIVDTDGTIFVSEYAYGELIKVNPDGTKEVFENDLFTNEVIRLNFDLEGNLYSHCGTPGPLFGTIKIDKQTGEHQPLALESTYGDFTFISEDEILFSDESESKVYKYTISTNTVDVVVSNRGVYSFAMDTGPEGYLYLGKSEDDDHPAQIVRIGNDGSETVYVDNLSGRIQDITFDWRGGLYIASGYGWDLQIYYFPPGGGDLSQISSEVVQITSLAVNPETGNLLATMRNGIGIAEYSLDGFVELHPIQLPKDPADFLIDYSPDGTLFAYASEFERRITGPEVDRWVLKIDIEAGSSEIVAQHNRIGCCVLGNLATDFEGNVFWIINPDFELYKVMQNGEITLFARNLPTDTESVTVNQQGDIYLSTPSGIIRIYKEN